MRAYAMLSAVLLLAACGSGDPEPATDAAKARTPTVIDDQLQAIEKAKAVEGDVMEDKKRLDEEIDAASGG